MIITDEKLLRTPCEDVSLDEANHIINILELELKSSSEKGIGLAAPQIGIYKRAAIIRLPSTRDINLINPKIINKYDKFIFEGEGCLSFPGKRGRTWRYKEIVVQNDIEPYKFIATNLLSICIQHEVNHLEGILLPDIILK